MNDFNDFDKELISKGNSFSKKIHNSPAVLDIVNFLKTHLNAYIEKGYAEGLTFNQTFAFGVLYSTILVSPMNRGNETLEYNYTDKGMRPLTPDEERGLELSLLEHLTACAKNNHKVVEKNGKVGR